MAVLEIRESQIEDIFATQRDEVKALLSIRDDISLINRQKQLPSGGILDLLFISAKYLHLLELKSVRSEIEFCQQVMTYRNDIILLQEKEEMPNLPVRSYLVCPDFLDSHKDFCLKNDIIPITFSPYELLKNFYFKSKAISKLVTVKPSNHGLWNLYLLNPVLYAINNSRTVSEISQIIKLSKSTIGSYLRLSTELGLTIVDKSSVGLTNLGKKYVEFRETDKTIEYISDKQTELLKEYITTNPFGSPAIYGVYSAVETTFALSKNFYPVPLVEAVKFFRYLSGKQSEWAEKASRDAFIMYSNYAIELGLLAKVGRNYYLTPAGIRFILLLELNKSILFVNSI